ncbi:MAG: ATP-binding protein [Planctomycetota bacterium]
MDLPFLNRTKELQRLRSALFGASPGLVCIYGRRRLGKSALLRNLLEAVPSPYYVGDAREAAPQRQALATEIGRYVAGFDAVDYRDWDNLLAQWWRLAPRAMALVIDEFPALVSSSPELPSLLQKHIDLHPRPLVLCGSSQRMMHGLVLDAAAPLYGRAREVLRIQPLELQWIRPALKLRRAIDAIEHFAIWGGVPRYWELAAEHAGPLNAATRLALDPLGVLHHEPERLLQDDGLDAARSVSVLSLVGQGCHRLSEIGARLGTPATSLSRPLARLVDLGLIVREVPFGRTTRDTKRTLYRLGDPFLAFWHRFVEPNRSRLAIGQLDVVASEVRSSWPQFLGGVWERMARDSVPRLTIAGRRWHPAAAWWGMAADRQPLELDVVARCVDDPRLVLVGEAKVTATVREVRRIEAQVMRDAARCPELAGCKVQPAVWVLRGRPRVPGVAVVTADDVVGRPPTPKRASRR